MSDAPARSASQQDLALVAALRAGDETAFMMLVERYQPAMLRIARMYVSTRAVAEEVVQDAWVGVLRGLEGFEGRSSLRTWISNQREVIRMRDVLGWPSSDVCNALDISETNQRVLLHRARAKVRRALERYLEPEREQGA
ncbi:MAG: sigma factor [Actinomycetota bacterium]